MHRIVPTLIILFALVGIANAADLCVTVSGAGSANGSDWDNALAQSFTPVRGNTYYLADGTYSSKTWSTAESSTTLITIKKATASDHVTETGWSSDMGDGQAVLGSTMTFTSGYWTIDGNGSHTVPSNTSSDYGIKINSDSYTNYTGIVRIGTSGNPADYVTLKYVHVYNTYNSSNKPGSYNQTVCVRWYPDGGSASTNTKIQNCYLQNSGKDGLQMSSADYILVERTYLERLSKKLEAGDPYYDHGQTVQMFWGVNNVIFRWNIWEACEGEGLLSHSDSGTTDNIRFYGNVIFTAYDGNNNGYGFNGGIMTQAADWNGDPDSWYVYNNTWVNQRDSYTSASTNNVFRNLGTHGTDFNQYNGLMYNSESFSHSGWANYDYGASGGLGTYGGANEQTGLSSSIFQDYENDDFRLASATSAGLDLTAQGWWSDGADSFFGQLDYNEDMYGNAFDSYSSNWTRGAFAYDAGGGGATIQGGTGATIQGGTGALGWASE